MRRTAVLLMAYGAARRLEDIPAYLKDIRGGRPVSDDLVREITERYRAMGGRSPLFDITAHQVKALASALGPDFAVYSAMRHSAPTIVETVRRIESDGLWSVLGIALTPFTSRLSTGAYRAKLDEAVKGRPLKVRHVEGWHDHPKLLEAYVFRINEALERVPEDLRSRTSLVMTAHSLPEKILEEGDPYVRQLEDAARRIAEGTGLTNWRFAYQSRAQGAREPWLGPDAGDVLEDLAGLGVKSVLLSPIGFLSENMETLYDDDVLYRRRAEELGMRFTRAAALNDHPALIAAMADVAARALVSQ